MKHWESIGSNCSGHTRACVGVGPCWLSVTSHANVWCLDGHYEAAYHAMLAEDSSCMKAVASQLLVAPSGSPHREDAG